MESARHHDGFFVEQQSIVDRDNNMSRYRRCHGRRAQVHAGIQHFGAAAERSSAIRAQLRDAELQSLPSGSLTICQVAGGNNLQCRDRV